MQLYGGRALTRCVCARQFFRPLSPVHVHMLFDDSGRPSGQANVDFSTHEEAVKAMAKVSMPRGCWPDS